mmetsp:Transcript_36836/g.84881  ORF Transcript_36836/g.84881 Transcript_36836/m.84881 type:complete len:253 (+) Transcript_36836:2537-3295(+)
MSETFGIQVTASSKSAAAEGALSMSSIQDSIFKPALFKESVHAVSTCAPCLEVAVISLIGWPSSSLLGIGWRLMSSEAASGDNRATSSNSAIVCVDKRCKSLTGNCPFNIAVSSGVKPSESGARISTWASNKAGTTSMRPCLAAKWIGVVPFLLLALASALYIRRSSTASALLNKTASYNAVMLFWPFTFVGLLTSAMPSSNLFSGCTWPLPAAKWIAQAQPSPPRLLKVHSASTCSGLLARIFSIMAPPDL